MNKKILLLLVALGIIYRIAALDAYGFWLDEARQFWVSKGVSHYARAAADFSSRDERMVSLFKNTSLGLLGSPLFTLFIQYWSKICNASLWLRFIPCLFSISILPLMYLIAIKCNFSKKWAAAITASCAWNAPWIYYSRELRPYSFEIFCSGLTLFFFIKILKNKKAPIAHYICFALTMLVGIFAGYGYNVYIPFVTSVLTFHAIKNDAGSKTSNLSRVFILIIPFIVSLFYIHYILTLTWKKSFVFNLGYNVTSRYLPYLRNYHYDSLWAYIAKVITSTISTISWQLFNIRQLRYPFLNTLPLGLPFLIATGLFLAYAIFVLFYNIKKRNIVETIVLTMFFYLLVAGVTLSTKGLYPMGPIRQNLFFTPVLFISFFLCAKHAYRKLKENFPKIKWNYFVAFLLMFLLMPNILREYKVVAFEKNRECIRPLLKEIQKSVDKKDKISVWVNSRSRLVFAYERRYSAIPWLKALKNEDVFSKLSCEAGPESVYTYQWYIFSDMAEIEQTKNMAKQHLEKEHNAIIDKEPESFSSQVAIFRARKSY